MVALIPQGAEVLGAAGDQHLGDRASVSGGQEAQQGAGEGLPVALRQLHQHLVQAVEDHHGGFLEPGQERVKGVLLHAIGGPGPFHHLRDDLIDRRYRLVQAGDLAEVEVEAQRDGGVGRPTLPQVPGEALCGDRLSHAVFPEEGEAGRSFGVQRPHRQLIHHVDTGALAGRGLLVQRGMNAAAVDPDVVVLEGGQGRWAGGCPAIRVQRADIEGCSDNPCRVEGGLLLIALLRCRAFVAVTEVADRLDHDPVKLLLVGGLLDAQTLHLAADDLSAREFGQGVAVVDVIDQLVARQQHAVDDPRVAVGTIRLPAVREMGESLNQQRRGRSGQSPWFDDSLLHFLEFVVVDPRRDQHIADLLLLLVDPEGDAHADDGVWRELPDALLGDQLCFGDSLTGDPMENMGFAVDAEVGVDRSLTVDLLVVSIEDLLDGLGLVHVEGEQDDRREAGVSYVLVSDQTLFRNAVKFARPRQQRRDRSSLEPEPAVFRAALLGPRDERREIDLLLFRGFVDRLAQLLGGIVGRIGLHEGEQLLLDL